MAKERSRIQTRVIKAGEGIAALAQKLGVTRQSLDGWEGIPSKHVEKISEITGIPKKEIRPDIYDMPE